MKRCLLLFCLLFWVIACQNDLSLISPNRQKTPVFYGLLSPSDTATYFRLQRAYTQNIDSLYYPINSVSVQLVRLSDQQHFTVQAVDAAQEGYPKNDGLFSKVPHILYKINNNVLNLQANQEWRLDIKQGDSILTSSLCKIVGNYEALQGQPQNPLNVRYDSDLNIGFRSDELSARAYDVRLTFHYSEKEQNGSSNNKSITWLLSQNFPRSRSNNVFSPRTTVTTEGKAFYQFLADNIPENIQVTRQFQKISLQISASGEGLTNFINNGNANIGITSSQPTPHFTNLTNGAIGLFSSQNTLKTDSIKLSSTALELLKNGDLTRKLRFQ